MIDPDEMEAFEQWKAAKLAGQSDLSVQAWNREQEALALAWADGAKAAFQHTLGHGENSEPLRDFLYNNPYRKPGMTGFQKPPAKLEGPHSRACGISRHEHGSECSSDCPTCHGTSRRVTG